MPVGILLAAGAGTRMGRPKALVRDDDGTSWLLRSVASLVEGGCSPVVVVLGAEAASASALLRVASVPASAVVEAVAPDWREGMGASLRAGLSRALALAAVAEEPSATACVTLVDLPDVDGRVIRRVTAAAGADIDCLVRAAYAGQPGHPVVFGRNHWELVITQLAGDTGARGYLAARAVRLVECADLATGRDVDAPEASP